ncbi:Hypothetical predicted protein [Octopus vulgaris]|uniref:Uncharacterized protein n=1 Tax=Octopus vulgaris TaxID=6645 RepID=A0AA36BNY5_OCTVU|nr:Hypothetical predicted protein [Octopus vulgaris]
MKLWLESVFTNDGCLRSNTSVYSVNANPKFAHVSRRQRSVCIHVLVLIVKISRHLYLTHPPAMWTTKMKTD